LIGRIMMPQNNFKQYSPSQFRNIIKGSLEVVIPSTLLPCKI
jgi:hypothetical protein